MSVDASMEPGPSDASPDAPGSLIDALDYSIPADSLTFPEVLAQRAAATPHAAALRLVRFAGREPQARPVTYGELHTMARRAASSLAAAGVGAGDRVILSLSAADVFVAFLVGAQSLGAVPAPLPSVGELQSQAYARRVASVARDAQPRAIVLDDPRAGEAARAAVVGDVAILDAASPAFTEAPLDDAAPLDLARRPDEVAFLQYTSGSTGAPKGVVVRQSNLAANLRALAIECRIDARDRIVSWLPFFHDMGLVGALLLGLYLAAPTYLVPARSFIARPEGWLRTISHYRGTLSPAPNFAFGVLARRIPDSALRGIDLSSWRIAVDGGEPVDAATARLFIERFAAYGFRAATLAPCYGMAECTLIATVPDLSEPPVFDAVDRAALAEHGEARPAVEGAGDVVTFVSVGRPIGGHTIRILATDADRALPERRLGEIAITGPSISPFYFHDLQSGAAPRAEHRTGDVGYFADGRLYVVDRLKDLLILAGRKYAPSDVEQVVGEVDGVKRGAVIAFARRGDDGTDELYVVAGVEPSGQRDPEGLRAAVRRAVQANIGVTPIDVVLVRPGEIPKTSSGKLQRAACKGLYEARALASIDAATVTTDPPA